MPIRITGMNSGLDTDAIIEALTSSYSAKKDKYTKAQTKLSWKQDAWKSLNTKVYGLYNSIGTMRYSSSYSFRTAKLSDSTKANVTVSSGAVTGTQTLRVTKLAKAGFLTGGKVNKEITSKTTMADLGIKGDSLGSIKVTVGSGADAKETIVNVKASDKVTDFLDKLNKAGVSASFDESNHRFFVNAKDSGVASDFTIEGQNGNGTILLSKFGLISSAQIAGSVASQLAGTVADASGNQKYNLAATKTNILNYLNDWATRYKPVKEAEETAYEAFKPYEDAYKDAKKLYDDAAKDPIYTEADREYLDGKVQEAKLAMETAREAYSPYKDAKDALENEEKYKFLSDIGFKYEDFVAEDGTFSVPDATINLYETYISSIVNAESATKINGEDGSIELNGVIFENSSNNYTINGLTIQALAETTDPVTITTSVDTQGLYDKIKDFLQEYNSVVNEMMKQYNAEAAKGYEPLTDDEKAKMSETEIEKWEAKIKSAVLRRDTTLNSVLTGLTTSMMKSYTIKGVSMSLTTFGIHTLGTLNAAKNENYAYHIDGDAEDTNTSGNKERLMAKLAEDPDAVIEFMQKLATDVYTELGDKMKSTSVSSIYTVYNDKEMASEYSSYNDLIKKWTNRAKDLEDSYYKKFATMESTLAKLQNSTSSLSSMIGQK